jgi:hypothetical protein
MSNRGDRHYNGTVLSSRSQSRLAVLILDFREEEEWSPGEIVVDRYDQYVWFAERTTTIRLDNPGS